MWIEMRTPGVYGIIQTKRQQWAKENGSYISWYHSFNRNICKRMSILEFPLVDLNFFDIDVFHIGLEWGDHEVVPRLCVAINLPKGKLIISQHTWKLR